MAPLNGQSVDNVVAFDLMGGDFGPPVTVPAVKRALSICKDLNVLGFGDPKACSALLNKHGLAGCLRFEFTPTELTVASDEKPGHALRHGKGTSMDLAINAVASGRAGSCVSAGNTGALMALSLHGLGVSDMVSRPALAVWLPRSDGHKTLMLDLGANVDCTPELLAQFAVLGSSTALGVAQGQPKVALLNVGIEHNKGNSLVMSADSLIKSANKVNYIGYVEADSIFTSSADVIVCDGFAGNIALKASEGLARFMKKLAKENLRGFWKLASPLIWMFAKKSMGRLFPDKYNGAVLLGLRGTVLKSHGSARAGAIANALLYARSEAERKSRLGV